MTHHYLLFTVLATWCLSHANCGFPNVNPTLGEPWPKPQQQVWDPALFRVDIDVVPFNITGETCADLEDAVSRYTNIIASFIAEFRGVTASRLYASGASHVGDDPPLLLEQIEVELRTACSEDQYPEYGMDESYSLTVNTGDALGRAVIAADTIWGAYRGLETMSQLFYYDPSGAVFVRSGSIVDFPRYSYRGFLLDTGRHFLSLDVIKQNLDLMAFHKYNVFHWHLVDDPSFPFYSVRFPLFVLGAFREDKIYSPDQVADVIEYARKRGIRVIPEMDTPGHTRSWNSYDILTRCYTDGEPDGTFGPLDPTNSSIYSLITDLLDEVTQRFPDRSVHIGGDEVSFGYDCWLSNPGVQAWMAERNYTTPQEVEAEYITNLLEVVAGLPEKPQYMVWQDVVDQGITIKEDAIVHVWKEPEWQAEMDKVTSLGHRTVLSSCWYLNKISYGIDWYKYYDCEPESFGGSAQQNELIIGGEACMWGEYVDDTNVVARSWPRAAAPAERLWSAKGANSHSEAAARLEEQRCRLIYRGFAAEPSNGPGFC
ncbi:beta-hexosaminidase subunit beta-like isoform X2 [Amphibalanus amphitrite]|uniref:beta-hexosaminidase subunit beta-like isoform X2 n=1 Tax=Amphibalanus amphitrite TaxID=1232801 RepID=UPI001C929CEC|nr:beta-hexosaminidase subunit beta-like isoform X2 [Amphibalanus amphitrite]